MIAIIGGEPHRFRPLVDMYREAGKRAGHAPESLKVGVHALGYVAETDAEAADDFFPGYAATFSKIGQERGWGPVTRRQFDALLGPTGALIVGGPETAIAKVKHYDEVLGGISRLSFQVSVAGLGHEKLMRAIGILGRDVAPALRKG
jgi:alkanesulfonate monooxygenase SsuD/methylene tetrahydromethanopterin reductase-like flavin-dependent oxidoreductase (luciferase family)